MQPSVDAPRPRSTWKVLGGLVLALVTGFVLVSLCVSAFVSSTPHRTLKVPRSELQVDLPHFYPLPTLGADAAGHTFGVWVVLHDDASADAFYSRDPRSGCHVPWRAELEFQGDTGWFRDPCLGGTYSLGGAAVSDPAIRGIDRFDAEVDQTTVTVDLERVRLGDCRTPEAASKPCSTPGQAPHYEDAQPTFEAGRSGG
jgi:hypothetical protein